MQSTSKKLHPDFIEEVKGRTDIVDVISEYVPLRKQGKRYMGCCPFHDEKTPSFSVDPDKGLAYCFGCSWGGDAIKFMMEHLHISFGDAVLDQARKHNIPIRYADGSTDSTYPAPLPRKAQKTPTSAPIPETRELAKLPAPVTHPEKRKRGANLEIEYPYSATQWVLRTEKPNPEKPKGYEKITLPYHLKENGEEVCGKGSEAWPAYRMDEVKAHGGGKWVLGVEGESCVEAARYLGLAAFTLQGGSWSEDQLASAMLQIKEAGVLGMTYLPDHDAAGYEKAKKLAKAAAKAGMPVIQLDPVALWPDIPEKGDIADWVKWGIDMDWQTREELLERLERSFNRECALRYEEERKIQEAIAANNPLTRFRADLLVLASSNDDLERLFKINEMASTYRMPAAEIRKAIAQSKNATRTVRAERLSGKELMQRETEAIGWIFPGIVPSRGVSVWGGHAGCGKTTLAYDAVGSLLLNEEFLGEKPAKTGKVLIVSSDELPCFTQDKLIDRGIPIDNDNWEIILNWDVSQWDFLVEAVRDIRPTLVVIDSFSSIHRDPSFDENSAQAKSTIYDLEALSNSCDFGLILIHHLSKSKENQGVTKLRGSSAISAAASTVCIMEATATGQRRLSFPKMRGAQTDPFLVSLDRSTGRFDVEQGGDDSGTKTLGDRILSFLQKSPHTRYKQSEISESLGIPDSNKDSVYQALGRLFKRGLITKRPSKFGGKRKVYGISNPSTICDNNVGDTSTKNATDTNGKQEKIQRVHTPPPPSVNVSVQISEIVDIGELQVTDILLTDNPQVTDTLLTDELEQLSVNSSNADTASISAKLTDIDSQGGCVCDADSSMNLSVQISETIDKTELQLSLPPSQELSHTEPANIRNPSNEFAVGDWVMIDAGGGGFDGKYAIVNAMPNEDGQWEVILEGTDIKLWFPGKYLQLDW
ncbi:MAG: CHC2 zinc finger domain-containing protein [Potamolinea sp.]